MDLRNWQKVLLQWISECNFMEKNYFNVEQTNIHVFFKNFCLKHNEIQDFDSITAFLQEYYPEFQLHVDDENTLSTGDYVYVYSLLLHFSCVKCPDEDFHGICQKLGENAQQCIAAFFKYLLGCQSLDKKHIRHAIAEVAPTFVNSPLGQQSESVNSSGSSSAATSIDLQTSYSSSPLRVTSGDSQMKTPNRKVVPVSGVSPSTPKSTLLEERTRELYKFKAQLETERYEKELLEFQIKQNEQEILNLNSTQKKLRQQIQSLKDDLLNQSVEPNGSAVEDDEIQKQLCRKINEREDEIFRLNDRIRVFGEEKTLLEKKLRHAEKKIHDYREIINEMDSKLHEYATDLEKKDSIIKCLTDDKAELEHFIAESRTASSNSRPDLNSSGDQLDSSFARCTNSSASFSSPENLGASVVDMQLREKEHEVVQLRGELTELREKNKKLSLYIQEKMQVYNSEFNIEIINAESRDDILDDPSTDFSFFLECMNHLSTSYRDAKAYTKDLEADLSALQAKNDDLQRSLEASKLELKRFNDDLNNLTEENNKIKLEKDNMDVNYKKTIEELEGKLAESEREQENLSSYIEGLKEKINLQMRSIESLDKQVTTEEASKLDLQKKFDDVQNDLLELKAENQNLEETAKLLTCKLQTSTESEEHIKKKNEELKIQNDELLQKAKETESQLETLGNAIQTKEAELIKLSKEIEQLHRDVEGMESEKKEMCKEIDSLCNLLKEEENNNSNGLVTLKEINEMVAQILLNSGEDKSRIDQLENIKKENEEKLQKIENKLREEIESNEKLLSQRKTEITSISDQLLKASDRIAILETQLKEMKVKYQKTVELERNRTEEVQKLTFEHAVDRKNWESKKEQLEAELSGEKEKYATRLEDLSKAQEQLRTYEIQLSELNCQKSEAEKDSLERLSSAEAKVDRLIKENEELKVQLEIKSRELISKTDEVSTHLERYDHTVQALESTKLELGKMKTAMEGAESDCEKKIAAISETLEAMSNEKKELETLLEKQRKELESKVHELAASTEACEKASLELKAAELNLQELKGNVEIDRNNFAALENEFKSKIQELRKETEELRRRNAVLEMKLKAEEEIRMNEKKEKKTLSEENLKIREEFLESVEESEKEIDRLKGELQKAREELEERKKELKEVRNSLAKVNEKLENEKKISENLKLSNKNQSEEIDQLRISELRLQEMQQKQNHELQYLHATAKKQSEELFVAYEDMVGLKEELQQKIDQITKHSLECEQAKMKAELEQVSRKYAEAKKQNDKLNDIIKEQEQKIEELRDQLRQTELYLKSVNEECTRSQGEVVAKEAEIRILSEELQQKEVLWKTQNENASETIKELEEDLNDVVNVILSSSIICESENDASIKNDILAKASKRQSVESLKKAINRVLIAIDQQQKSLMEIPNLQSRLKELNEERENTQMNYKNIQSQFRAAQTTIEELENEKKSLENEIERYADSLHTLEEVNLKMSEEIESLCVKLSNKTADLETLQMNNGILKAVNDRLTAAQEKLEVEYKKTVEALNGEQIRLRETIDSKESALGKLQLELDEQQRRAKDEVALQQEKLKLIESELMQSNAEKAKRLEKMQQECATLAAENQELFTKNTELNAQAVELQKDCITLRAELSALNEKFLNANEELATSLSQIEEANANCNAYYEKLEKLNAKHTLLESNFKEMQTQLTNSNSESEALMFKYKTLTTDKQNLTEELSNNRREIQELKQTIHNLNQKLALSDLEKDDLRRQLQLLHKQVEVNSRYQTTSESQIKNILETTQALERNLLSSENALKTTRATLEQSKVNIEKLDTENKKLTRSLDAVNKRVEKLALKLGESQAEKAKAERENEKLTKSSEAQKVTIETLQREKDIQQLECKTLKERLNRAEQQLARVQNTEKSNASLMEEKKKLETAEVDFKSKITKLKNTCQITEERLRKMTHNYDRCERENVTLNHQIGALNTEIQMLRSAANDANNEKIAELKKTISEISAQSKAHQELSEKLSSECGDLQQENQNLDDQLSKAVLALEISKAKSDQLGTEVQQLEAELKKLRQEKMSMEQAQSNVREQIEAALSETRNLEKKIRILEDDVGSKEKEISSLRQEVNELRQSGSKNSTTLLDKASKLVSEVETLRSRLLATEGMLEKEQESNAKLRTDNQILLAKYQEAKQRIEDEVKSSEERVKETRLELEGKLEKMKTKMKALYTEEVTKMKAKQERETAKMRSDLSLLKAENAKYQEHTQKLSTELMTLNERMLECQKQNTYLKTKLKHAQNDSSQFKRPNGALKPSSSATLPRISSTQSIPPPNLAMEDEEGELFNNTYLMDMKNGRMSEIAPEELQHRNSLLPPHLKSSYAVQYQHGLCEDEVKDGTSSTVLDDSMSALLNSTGGCVRKKLIGVTNYWKPGPPTPAKNSGRLSLGGSSEPAREILKESYGDNTPTSSKTPARFGFFSSRFSLGNNNTTSDEKPEQQEQPEQQQPNNSNHHQDEQKLSSSKEAKMGGNDLRRVLQIKNMERLKSGRRNDQNPGAIKICTSTPRKSHGRTMFEKRRLIAEIQKEPSSASSVVETLSSSREITPLDISNIETPTSTTATIFRRRQSSSATFVKKGKRTSMGSSSAIAALQRRIRRGARRERVEGGAPTRPSLCVNKNLYANKACTPQRGAIRDLKRIMGRKNRMLRFDAQRMIMVNNNRTNSSEAEDTEIECSEQDGDEEESPGKTIEVVGAAATFAVEKKEINQATLVVVAPRECGASEGTVSDDTSSDGAARSSVTVSDNELNTNTCSTVATTTSSCQTIPTLLTNEFDKKLEKLQEEIYSDMGSSSQRFEQLLKETASQAPFEIRSIRLSSIGGTHSDSGMTSSRTNSSLSTDPLVDRTNSHLSSSAAAAAVFGMTSKISSDSSTRYTTVTATPHQSPQSPSSLLQHSRTIYGASVIFNPRIPNVDGLRVRKSSIYFKKPKCSTFRSSYGLSAIDSNGTNSNPTAAFSQDGEGDLILVTNQTITLYDLICMWQQMSIWTRLFVFTMLSVSVGAIAMLVGVLYSTP